MKKFYLNDKCYTEFDVAAMSLDEIEELLYQLQEERHRVAKEKMLLSTLPKGKKDYKSLQKLRKCQSRAMDLQDAQSWVGKLRKKLRISLSQEKEWYKTFYKLVCEELRKGTLDKITSLTNEQTGYEIVLY